MRYGLLLLLAVLSAGCGLFPSGPCEEGDDCDASVCCAPPLTLKCSPTPLEGRKLKLELEFGGGSRPYAYTVNWGDGDEEHGSEIQFGSVILEHTFRRESQQYSMRVAARDTVNATATCELSHTFPGTSTPGG